MRVKCADGHEDEAEDEGGAEVWLLHHEGHRHDGDERGQREVLQGASLALRVVVQVFRERDDEEELHELARLER